MQRVCKDSGHILLLEHGISGESDWINHSIDATATKHANTWGIYFFFL
jgi:hypothetical protein